MAFLKRSSTVETRLAAVDERIADLCAQRLSREKSLDERKTAMQKALGELALTPNEQNEDSAKRAKKTLIMAQDALEDVIKQIEFLEGEKVSLTRELLLARLRDIPQKASIVARQFNEMLTKALEAVKELRKVHADLKILEGRFYDLLRLRQSAQKELGVQEPLSMDVGLGELSGVGSPHGYAFTVPDFDRLLIALVYYQEKVAGYKAFLAANPTWKADEAARASLPQQRAGFGDVGPVRAGHDIGSAYVDKG